MPARNTVEVIIRADGGQAASTLKQFGVDLEDVGEKAKRSGGLLGAFTGGIRSLVTGLGSLGFAAMGIQALASGIAGVASSMVAGNAEFERYTTQFGVLLGSTDAAKARLEDLAEFGAKTPFELPEVVRADKILQGFGLHAEDAAERFGFAGEQIRTIAGDVAAGTGAGFEEIAGYIGKFSSGATGEAIARFQELGIVTRAQLAEMGLEFKKSGELVTPVDEAMGVLLQAMKGKFGGMMDAQSATFEGMVSNLQDWIGQTKRTLMQPIFEVLKARLGDLLTFLGSPAVQATLNSIAQGLANGIGSAIDAIGRLSGIVGDFIGYLDPGNQRDLMREWFGDAGPVIDDVVRGVKQVADVIGTLVGYLLRGDLDMFTEVLVDWTGIDLGPFVEWGRAAVKLITDLAGAVVRLVQSGDLRQFVSDIIAAYGDYLPALANLGQAILGFVVEMVPKIAAQLLAWGQQLWAWIEPQIPPLLAELGRLAGQLWAWVQSQAPVWLAQLQVWGGQLVAWIEPQIPPLLAELGVLTDEVWEWIQAQAGPLLDQLMEWAVQFAAWLVPAAEEFLREWPTILETVLDQIAEAAGPILEQLGEWAIAFVKWIIPMIPDLLLGLAGVSAAIVAFIAETALVLGEKLVEWGLAFVGWLAPHIPDLLVELGKMLLEIVNWIIFTALPAFHEKLGEWAVAFVQWIIPTVPKVIAELVNLHNRIGDWIVGEALPFIVEKLLEWGRAFVDWTEGVVRQLPNALQGVLDSILTWLTEDALPDVKREADNIGRAIIQGIEDGVRALKDSFFAMIRDLAKGALDAAKKALGIGSPSKEFAKVGKDMIRGIIQGLREGESDLLSEMRSLADQTSRVFSTLLDLSLPGAPGAGVLSGAGRSIQAIIDALTRLDPTFGGGLSGWIGELLDHLGEQFNRLGDQARVYEEIKSLVDSFLSLGMALPPDLILAIQQIAAQIGGPFADALKALLDQVPERAVLQQLKSQLAELDLAEQIAKLAAAYAKMGMALPEELRKLLEDLPRVAGSLLDEIIKAILGGEIPGPGEAAAGQSALPSLVPVLAGPAYPTGELPAGQMPQTEQAARLWPNRPQTVVIRDRAAAAAWLQSQRSARLNRLAEAF